MAANTSVGEYAGWFVVGGNGPATVTFGGGDIIRV